MNLTWQKSESLVAPRALDTTISSTAVYIRKNIKVAEEENQNGETVKKYIYDEAIITQDEYKELGDTDAKVLYELALNTPVEYPANGHVYMPSYISDYKREMDDIKAPLELIQICGGDISSIVPDIVSKTVNIYDATRESKNKIQMNIFELSKLYYFLYFKKEDLYNEYREALDSLL